MTLPNDLEAATIYTIGHSNYPLDRLLHLLELHRIQVLVDTRSSPYSRYTPHFNNSSLKLSVPAAGMRYVYLGKELGGRPEGDEYYDSSGHVLYARVAESPRFKAGVEKLTRGVRGYRVALLCSEEDPSGCHRRLLVGRVLRERGISIQHIRADGSLQPEEDLIRQEEAEHSTPQLSLFEVDAPAEWKSVRPVHTDRRLPE